MYILYAFVRQIEPNLQQIHPQHQFDSACGMNALFARIVHGSISAIHRLNSNIAFIVFGNVSLLPMRFLFSYSTSLNVIRFFICLTL